MRTFYGKFCRTQFLPSILLLLLATSCSRLDRGGRPPTIAVIPQSAGGLLWDVEHAGAITAAEKLSYHLYWNAPTSESDTAGQASLVDKVARGDYQGLILAPNHNFAILSPVHRVIAAGIPIVIVSAPIELPANSGIGYVVNDDGKMGELAAIEIAKLVHGNGSIALVGLTRATPGVASRVRSAEQVLASRFPEVRVVGRTGGAYNASRAEELTTGLLDAHSDLKAILSFTAASTRGVHAALKAQHRTANEPGSAVTLVGCEQDVDLIDYVGNGEIAAIVAENTYLMGSEAMQLISASRAGKPFPERSLIPPVLITKLNFNTVDARLFTGLGR